jgi:hypothetical protein
MADRVAITFAKVFCDSSLSLLERENEPQTAADCDGLKRGPTMNVAPSQLTMQARYASTVETASLALPLSFHSVHFPLHFFLSLLPPDFRPRGNGRRDCLACVEYMEQPHGGAIVQATVTLMRTW